jgi:lysophospholipase L1-like esterase
VRYVRTHRGRVEYDVSFETNALGLVDDLDYADAPRVARQVALVGDSFTAGYHGGDPWVPAMRRRSAAEGVRFYNLGIGGAGFLQFEALLRSVARHVQFTDVVLIAISDDFQRGRWRMDVDGDDARFCLVTWPRWLCRLRFPFFHRIDLDSDPKRWIERNRDKLLRSRRSALASVVVQVARAAERTDAERAKRIAANERAIESIVATYGSDRVSFVHLPVRQEVERGAYTEEADGLANRLRTLGVDYLPALHACRWEPNLFFGHDDHPNAAGYARIEACVDAYLRRRMDRPGDRSR